MHERDIFMAALQRDQPADRRGYLDEVCRGDAALRARVETLLEVHSRAGSFLEVPVAGAAGWSAVFGGQVSSQGSPGQPNRRGEAQSDGRTSLEQHEVQRMRQR